MSSPVKAVVPFVRENEEDERRATPMGELYLWPIPMPIFKMMSDAAARKGMTFGQLLGKAISHALEE